MKRLIGFASTFALMVLLIFVSPTASAQLKPSDAIKSLLPYVGVWNGAMDAYGDRPAGTLTVRCEQVCDGSYLQFKAEFAPQGSNRSMNVENILLGFDGSTRKVRAWCFAQSAHAQGEATIDGTRIALNELKYVHADGSNTQRNVEYLLNDPDQMAVRIFGLRRNGTEMPDWPTLTLKRSR